MTDKRKQRELIANALRGYVNLGLPVIPLCAHDHEGYSERHITTCKQAGKVPIIKGWREHEVTTMEQVQAWLREFKNINIGLPLGASSGYVGIDVDGDLGEELLLQLAGEDLPETWEYFTGAGRRLLYQIPVGMKTKKYVNPADGEHEECSIICEGQQTVLPPSIHHTGRVYEWVDGRSPTDIDCAMAPEWLLDLIRVDRPNQQSEQRGTIQPILIAESTIGAEFVDYHTIELDLEAPDVGYMGKAAKGQNKEDDNRLSSEELMQVVSSGNRDNHMTRIIGSFCAQLRHMGKEYILLMAKNHNRQFCDPPLDDYAIEAKVNHFWELEQMKSSQFKKAGEDGGGKRFAPIQLAQACINVLEDEGYLFKVDASQSVIWMTKASEGPWQPIDSKSPAFATYLKAVIEDPKYGGDSAWTTIRHFKDVAHAIVVQLRASGRIWQVSTKDQDTQTLDNYKYIPLAGGKLLNWQTGELKAWDPNTHLTYVLPVEYDPAATAPNWEQRLKEWLPDEGSRNILQEFIGYTLIPYMGFEKALVIQGEGANGKSLFLETIQGLLGYQVVDSINMRNLFSRFGQAELVGKILNIVNEAGSDYLRGSHADDFKNLVSGGRVKADVKNLSPITFNNTAKFIFASNHDVKTGDKSEGWLRRLLIVPFEQDFSNSEVPKYEIMEALRKEYPGIFNWALEGLRRLMRNKAFSNSDAANRKKLAYIRENDIAADFYMQCLEKFDLSEMSVDGRPVRAGTPSALINNLFASWVEYRESTVQKKTDHITKYLTRKQQLSKARTTHTLLVKKVMTECWIGLRVHIRDVGFLEFLLQEPIPKYPELREYAEKRLRELDEAEAERSKTQPQEEETQAKAQ